MLIFFPSLQTRGLMFFFTSRTSDKHREHRRLAHFGRQNHSNYLRRAVQQPDLTPRRGTWTWPTSHRLDPFGILKRMAFFEGFRNPTCHSPQVSLYKTRWLDRYRAEKQVPKKNWIAHNLLPILETVFLFIFWYSPKTSAQNPCRI